MVELGGMKSTMEKIGVRNGSMEGYVSTHNGGSLMKSYFPKIRFHVGLSRWLIAFSLLLTALTIGQILQSSALAVADPYNKPPVANPDSATTSMNATVDIAVLDNDSDPNGDSLVLWAF